MRTLNPKPGARAEAPPDLMRWTQARLHTTGCPQLPDLGSGSWGLGFRFLGFWGFGFGFAFGVWGGGV